MAGLFSAAGLLVIAGVAICFAYRRRSKRNIEFCAHERVVEGELTGKDEERCHLQRRTGTTSPHGPVTQFRRYNPFASPELLRSGHLPTRIPAQRRTEVPATESGSQPPVLPLSPPLDEPAALSTSRYHFSTNPGLPNYTQPPPLIPQDAIHWIRKGEKGKGRVTQDMTPLEFLPSCRSLSKDASSKSSRSRTWSSQHEFVAISTLRSKDYSLTSSTRERLERWNSSQTWANRDGFEWAMFGRPPEASSTGMHTRGNVDSNDSGATQLIEKDGEVALSFNKEPTGKRQLPVLPLLSFQRLIEPMEEAEDSGARTSFSQASREKVGSRTVLPDSSKPRKGSKTDCDARGSDAVFTFADALTYSPNSTELEEFNASWGQERSPFTPSRSIYAQIGRHDSSPKLDLHPYAR